MDLSSKPTSSMASLWYCRIHGLDRGPITWDMLQELAQAGDLRPSDLVRRGDQTQWIVASQARFEEPVPQPPPLAAPIETKLTARLAAALAVDVDAAHTPAKAYSRPARAASAEVAMDREKAVEAETSPMDEEVAVATPAAVDETPLPEQSEQQIEQTDVQTVALLPARAAVDAIRNAKPRNPGGVALLALGLALIGLFKLALPLGLLSLYLAWRSAADLRRRPIGQGMASSGVGLTTAVAAMIVAGIDVSVSVYYIAR